MVLSRIIRYQTFLWKNQSRAGVGLILLEERTVNFRKGIGTNLIEDVVIAFSYKEQFASSPKNAIPLITWLLEEKERERSSLLSTLYSHQSYLKDDTSLFQQIDFNVSAGNFPRAAEMNSNEFALR